MSNHVTTGSNLMESFPIVKHKDIELYDDYRIKLQTLDIYNRMQEASTTGTPYLTLLDPSPADPREAHPPTEVTLK